MPRVALACQGSLFFGFEHPKRLSLFNRKSVKDGHTAFIGCSVFVPTYQAFHYVLEVGQ